jgi:hypothetical protein
MINPQKTSYSQSLTDFQPEHIKEFRDSAIADDIIALNFQSFDGSDENEREEAFLLLKNDPQHNNNGTLAGKSQNDLANGLCCDCWIYQGHSGVIGKLNSPRKDKEGKPIKYESPRDIGVQLFIPHVSIRASYAIAENLGIGKEEYQRTRNLPATLSPNALDEGFWDWFKTTKYYLLVTEASKNPCSLIAAGFPAIGLSGIWGWASNEKDENGEKVKNEKGFPVKVIHPGLLPLLNGREIIFALDCDKNRITESSTEGEIEKITKAIEAGEKSKKSFYWAINGKEGKGKYEKTKFTEIKWDGLKGIDDYLASQSETEREVKLTKLISNRFEIDKLKSKPSTNQTSSATDNNGKNDDESTDEKKKETAGAKALRLAKSATYFHTVDKVAYADVPIDGNRHTYAVRSRAFRLWLTGAFYRDAGYGLSPQVLVDLFPTLEAIAICDGETRDVHLRIAEHQGKLYLDLGTEDWKAIEVDASGWRLISDSPVRFWRPDSLLPLPVPVEGGSLDELKELLNVDRQSWVMIATFLLFCFCPNKTYPVLVLAAHRGSGKTAAAEIIKGLIDPGKAGLIKLQGDTHKLAIAATRRHLMVYDNVGYISPDQSDDLCRIATGFGYSTRTLHTTDEETTFEFTRPQIITAIDALVTRDDLADRVLMAQLPEIPEDKRLSQGELNEKVESSRPRILGALLTALSQTLAELPHTKPDKLPRMADYALFAIASEKALGLKDGEFMQTFNESREQSRQVVIESSPVGEAIVRLMEKTPLVWKGTASELLNELEKHTDEATYRSRYFPKASNQLTRQLNRLAPDLKALGIEVSSVRQGGGNRDRYICLERGLKTSQPHKDTSHSSARVLTEEDF